ncbi:MAG: hypothetical protein RL152_1234 [Bacteroidota bacterium]
MKFNWGYKILFVYLAFAGGILYMVYLTTLQNRDLVSENYYEEELAYQKVIDQSAKTAQLSGAVKVNLNQIKRVIEIQLPPEFNNINAVGKWNLYFAANQKMDLEGTLNTNDGSQAIQLPQGRTGNYTLKLEWESNGLSYYFEEIIFL